MKAWRGLLGVTVVAIGVGVAGAQAPILVGIEAPYAALQSTVRIAGATYGPGAVNYGPVGTPLWVTGSGMGASGTVQFVAYKNGAVDTSVIPAQATVTMWSSNMLMLTVPPGAYSGLMKVTVEGKTSNGLPFMVTPGSYSSSCPQGPSSTQLQITTASLHNGTVGQAYSATLGATGGTTAYSWSITSGTLPGGLSLNASTGTISGTPTAATGPVPVTFQVTDSSSPKQTNDAVLSLTIESQTLTGTPIYSYTANSYDGVGNVTNYTDTVMGTWGLSYDSLNRLTAASATWPNSTSQYACWNYDAFGNRLSESMSSTACGSNPPLTSWAQYNGTVNGTNNNQISSTNARGITATPGYDPAGDVTSDGVNQYLYDAEGRICAVKSTFEPGITTMIGYLYDADGTRVAKGTISTMSCDPTANGFQFTENYVLGPSGEELTMLDGGDNWQRTNVYVGGKLLATYDAAGLHFHLTDPLGTRRMQVSGNLSSLGQPETDIQSLPFGDQLNIFSDQYAPATADDATPLYFTGKERDTESGNDYFEARYYASSMGRFLSPDWSAKEEPVPYAKLGNPQTLNLYAYVYNNPLSNVDPDGHLGCGFLWLSNCPAQLAPPPPPPAPPALAVAGTPPSNLADAQTAARNNPANAPSGTPGTPERTTHCNQATCQIATATNAPTGALLDPRTGLPNLANTDAKTLANSSDWAPVTPQTAQDLATLGVTVLGVAAADPHGHIVTVAPEMLPGDQNLKKYGPLINNIGGSIGVTNANKIFRSTQPTYYAPTTPQW